MFDRLNRYLSPLKPQELRHSTYRGPFLKLAERLADDEYWAENKIVTTAAIRRMGDVEFVSELLIGVMHGPQGGSAAIIDEYYAEYEDYEDEFPQQRSTVKSFQKTLNLHRPYCLTSNLLAGETKLISIASCRACRRCGFH